MLDVCNEMNGVFAALRIVTLSATDSNVLLHVPAAKYFWHDMVELKIVIRATIQAPIC